MTGAAADQDTVVLVHGLWMHGWVMRLMGMRLQRCGFHPVFFSYPSMRNSLSQNALLLSNFVANIAAPRVHFIGHSLGGLLVLQMLAEYPQQRIGRVILAGSPYNGSRVATKLSRIAPGRYILGRSMPQWLSQEIPERNDQCELGVIAGHKSIGGGRLISRLPHPNDGVVAVEETKMPGTSDEIVLNVSHSGMLLSAVLVRQACSFLRVGHFLRNPELSL
ncbi:alpha/beta hydrolase family protein [Nitrosospira sp. Nsp5]|uniref:Alpha/beta hydrolase family protein n=1 Tax=Nitrosospira multiformis TaxID=1231 RepID=A0ABY0TD90_9PROT|nr:MULTISPECIES: alpha/beta hydrolase [Nitrosospira]PTR06178.1 alpha/beta hydrolase family protein [Nitrosospira sp. Nsp5]SDQ65428.1 Alpha/beta hydrolase family protein [Nitrosospira multiformis]